MAVVQNKTDDTLTLYDGRTVKKGDLVDVDDVEFVDRAWPKSTWSLAKKPAKGFVDASTDDAVVFVSKPDETVAELRAQAEAQGVDLTGLTKKDDIAAAIAKGPNPSEESA